MLALFLAAAIAWDAHCGAVPRKVVESQPFESAAIAWRGDANLRIRTSADGKTWSDWTSPRRDGDAIERQLTAITHFGATKRFIEYAFDAPVAEVTVTTFPPAAARTTVAAVPGAIRTRVEW